MNFTQVTNIIHPKKLDNLVEIVSQESIPKGLKTVKESSGKERLLQPYLNIRRI